MPPRQLPGERRAQPVSAAVKLAPCLPCPWLACRCDTPPGVADPHKPPPHQPGGESTAATRLQQQKRRWAEVALAAPMPSLTGCLAVPAHLRPSCSAPVAVPVPCPPHCHLVLQDLDSLSTLPRLKYLSLLDNPVTKQPNYRLYVVARCKKLKVLDFKKIKQNTTQRHMKLLEDFQDIPDM